MDRRTALLAGGAALVLPHGALRAQAFPTHPISLYCAFPAGGPTDQVMRAFADVAGRELKQSIVVENKPRPPSRTAIPCRRFRWAYSAFHTCRSRPSSIL
jgi:hypothetical protein